VGGAGGATDACEIFGYNFAFWIGRTSSDRASFFLCLLPGRSSEPARQRRREDRRQSSGAPTHRLTIEAARISVNAEKRSARFPKKISSSNAGVIDA
jgi:hypothetical protein